MNKFVFYFIFLLLFIIYFSACEELFITELEIDDYPVNQRLVLNSVIQADTDSTFLFFNNSYSFFDKNTSRKYILDPYTHYWKPERPGYLTDVDVFVSKNEHISGYPFILGKDSAMYFRETFKPGDKVSVRAVNDKREITATTVIPEKPVIVEVDTVHFKQREEGLSGINPRLRLLVKIKDQPGKNNYYRIYVSNELVREYKPEYVVPGYSNIRIDSYPHFETDDPLLNKGYTTSFEIIDGLNLNPQENNSYSIFTDELFENGEYTLNLHMEDWTERVFEDNPMILSMKHRVKIGLTALSDSFYFYLNSLQKQQQLNENRIEPIQVYNNIEGGLGLFGAMNELEYIVLEREIGSANSSDK